MGRKSSLINFLLTFAMTLISIFFIVYFGQYASYGYDVFVMIALYMAGAFIAGFLCTVLHELGHIAFAKANGFAILSVHILFFKWKKENNKFKFSFTFPYEEMGSVELVAKSTENLAKRYKKATSGSIWFTAPLILVGIVPIVLYAYLPFYVFAILAMFLPISFYSVLGNGVPMVSNGCANDGGTLLQLKKDTDSMKVHLSILAIQSELYNGKTPSEVDEKLYFDLPQLAEDDVNFMLILNARYNYYLDKKDYDNAKKTLDRLMMLLDYMPKSMQNVVKADALYNACTFDYNEDTADDLMLELDKYLNKDNSLTNIRIKLAYILGVERDFDKLELFYNKGLKEAKKSQIKGLALFETKLLDELTQMKND